MKPIDPFQPRRASMNLDLGNGSLFLNQVQARLLLGPDEIHLVKLAQGKAFDADMEMFCKAMAA